MNKKICIHTFLFFLCSLTAMHASNLIQDFSNHSELQRLHYVKTYGAEIAKYRGWLPIIDKVMAKLVLQENSRLVYPYETLNIGYSIIQNNSFNALSFALGTVIVHTGLLDKLDMHIAAKQKKSVSTYLIPKSQARENLIAPILAHELAHLFHFHALKHFFYNISNKTNRKAYAKNAKDHGIYTYSQSLEIEADRYGLYLLGRSGYDKIWYTEILLLLQDMWTGFNREIDIRYTNSNQSPKATDKMLTNMYFLGHPTPLRRLTAIEIAPDDYYRDMHLLEITFANIQLGHNLLAARATLLNFLKKPAFEKNYEILRAMAICDHKIWLSAVKPQDLLLKSALDMPSFRIDMTSQPQKKGAGSSGRQNSRRLYQKAQKSYQKIFHQGYIVDNILVSSYAALLAYSEDDSDKEKALSLARDALSDQNRLFLRSNLAIVLFQKGKTDLAINSLQPLPEKIILRKHSLQNIGSFNELHYQDFQTDFNDYTAMLNLALLYHYQGQSQKAKDLALQYLFFYESSSHWAKFLAEQLQLDITPMTKQLQPIPEIVLTRKQYTKLKPTGLNFQSISKLSGESAKKATSLLGQPTQTFNLGHTMQIFYYQDLQTYLLVDNKKYIVQDIIISNMPQRLLKQDHQNTLQAKPQLDIRSKGLGTRRPSASAVNANNLTALKPTRHMKRLGMFAKLGHGIYASYSGEQIDLVYITAESD